MTTFITREQGYTGFSPEIVRIVTTSTLSQVTTAGWYNNSPIAGESLSNVDVVLICYSYASSSQATSLFSVAISATGVVTLSLAESDVVLPTIANHIATYTNTIGTLSEDPATAISGGNIQAGLSGTAGTLASFPATASKGSFIFKAVANTGNTNTTLSNDAMGQASIINIPDPANAVGQLLVGATATPFTSGNFPQNSGTAGLMVDSGLAVSNVVSKAAVNQMGAGGEILFDKSTGTVSTGAVTINKQSGVITGTFTTAAAGTTSVTFNNSEIVSTSVILVSLMGGSNTVPGVQLSCAYTSSGVATLVVTNNNVAGSALSGTLIIGFVVL
jgi:hypothetical protein